MQNYFEINKASRFRQESFFFLTFKIYIEDYLLLEKCLSHTTHDARQLPYIDISPYLKMYNIWNGYTIECIFEKKITGNGTFTHL